jgi:hypothetical protein
MLRARPHGQSSPSLLSSTLRGARAGDGKEIRSTLFRIRFDRVRVSQVSRPSLIAVWTAGQVSGTVAQAGRATSRGDAARLPEPRSPSRENRAHDSGQRGEPVEHGHEKQRQGDVYLARRHPRAASAERLIEAVSKKIESAHSSSLPLLPNRGGKQLPPLFSRDVQTGEMANGRSQT